MPNALIISVHPNVESFNLALAGQATAIFEQNGWTVTRSDLYQMGFNPAMGPKDAPALVGSGVSSLPQMQLHALQQDCFEDEIKQEQGKLLNADLVILQFPLWWGSYPAMLKGWIDRVCSYGFAYGPAKQLSGKAVMLSVTTGGAANDSEHQYYLNKINGMSQEVFGYMAMEVLAPFLAHGPASKDEQQRAELIAAHQKVIEQVAQQLL